MLKADRLGWLANKKMGANYREVGKVGRFVATQGDGLIGRKITGMAG
jgi:hypothetical protein